MHPLTHPSVPSFQPRQKLLPPRACIPPGLLSISSRAFLLLTQAAFRWLAASFKAGTEVVLALLLSSTTNQVDS